MTRASSWLSHSPPTVGFSPCRPRCRASCRGGAIVGDEAGCDGEDMAAGSVIALEPDHRRAGEIALEAQDVVDVGAAPAVDRLVVVADAAHVAMAWGQQPQPQILDDVGVLVFVDQQIAPAPLIVGEDFRPLVNNRSISSSRSPKSTALSASAAPGRPVDRRAAAVGEAAFVGRRALGIEAAVLPASISAGQRARGPALVVDVLGLAAA